MPPLFRLFKNVSLRNDLVANCVVNELGDGMQAKPIHDLCPVSLRRPHRDPKLRGNLLICFSLSHKSNNFNLAWSWPGLRLFRRLRLIAGLEKALQYDVGYFGGEEELARRHVSYRLHQMSCEIRLQDVPGSASKTRRTIWSDSCIVRTTTLVAGDSSRILRVACNPSRSGIVRSTMATSGFSLLAFSIAPGRWQPRR